MKYMVVEKDINSEIGFIHHGEYKTIREANKWVRALKRSLGTEYYEIFVAEVE